jgi:hypothetical protein
MRKNSFLIGSKGKEKGSIGIQKLNWISMEKSKRLPLNSRV